MYAVPERKSRSRSRGGHPGVVTDLDESIGEEEAPPIPERGYTRYILLISLPYPNNTLRRWRARVCEGV